MCKRLATLLVMFGCVFAFAQEDDDIPPPFQHLITPEQYFQLRDGYLNLLRGLPADPSLRDKAVRLMQTQQQTGPKGLSPQTWTPLGPSPIPNGQVTGSLAVSGRVTAIEIDPTNSNKIYVGAAQGGVYRSLDGGTTWVQIFDGAKTSAIGALALAPSSPTTLFVGTGEANQSADSYAGVGVYRIDNCDTVATLVGPINPIRSYNDGSGNPQNVPVFNGRSVSSILVNPTDPTTIYVGTNSGVIGQGGNTPFGGTVPPEGMRGLYRLTNATSAAASVVAQKLTVTLAASGFDTPNTGNRSVTHMVFDPGNANDLIVWILGNAAAGDGGIYQSLNAQSANPTFTQVLTTGVNSARGQFAIYKQGAGVAVVYAATGEGTNGQVRVSVDAGTTWSAALPGGKGFCGGQCFYNVGFDVRPGATTALTDDIIVLGGNVSSNNSPGTRLFGKSTDGGATFPDSSAGLHADTHFIRIDPNNNNIIYHGNDGGIFKTIDGGVTWTTLNTMPLNVTQFSGLAVHPTDPNWSLGGTQDNGTNMRKSDGTWTRVDFGDGGYALVDKNATDTTNMTMYHTYFNQTNNLLAFGRVLSTACASDGNWAVKGFNAGTGFVCDASNSANGILGTDSVLFYAPMELGPGNPNTLYYGAGAVYRSTDKGDTMTAVSQRSGNPVSTIAVSPQDDNYRMFGRTDGTVDYTTTGANPMTALMGIPAQYIGRVKFDPSNKNTAYVTLGGYFGGTSTAQSHVWKVINLSTTPVVTGINSGLPDVPVNSFAVDPANSNALFAGTDIGVYASFDGGASWNPYGTGLPVVAIFGAEIQPQARKLRVGTHGRGLWDTTLGVAQVPATLTATAGSGQTAPVSTAYATALTALVKDGSNNPVSGVTVTFTAPASGASGTFPGAVTTVMVTTSPTGVATAPTFTANATAGPFTVTASINALTAQFNLQNIVATPPTADSVTGIAANNNTQSLTLKYSSVNGFGYLTDLHVLFNSSITAAGGCWIDYNVPSDTFYLLSDGVTPAKSFVAGTVTSISNGQCILFGGPQSTVSGSGNTLTVVLGVSFTPAFGNAHAIYMFAADVGGLNSGWQLRGSTAGSPSTPPTADSVSGINAGSLTQNTLALQYSSVNGAAYLMDVYALFNGSLSGANGCLVLYDRNANGFYLMNNAGTTLLGPLAQNAATSLSNSQCTLNGTGSSVSLLGNALTMHLNVVFSATFGAAQTVFMYAADAGGLNSGWQQKGSTGSATAPTADSATSSSPGSLTQTVTLNYSSANGYSALTDVHALFNSSVNGVNACWVFYDKASNGYYLVNDAGTAFLGPLAVGSASTLSNTQCTLNGTGSSVSGLGNTLTMALNLTFAGGFGATHSIFMYATDAGGLNSGWQQKGSTGTAPTAVSVTGMMNGSASQSLSFQYSSPGGFGALTDVYALVNSSLTGANGCWVLYDKASNGFYLANDMGSSFMGPLTPGSAGTLTNSQCTLNGSTSTVGGAAQTLFMNLNLTFTIFHGAKTIYGYAADSGGMNSGWQNLGSVTLP